MNDREPFTFHDYHQRIHQAVGDIIKQANADIGAEVIAPDSARSLVLADGRDFQRAYEAAVSA